MRRKRILIKTIFFVVCFFLCAISFYYISPRNAPEFDGAYNESIVHSSETNQIFDDVYNESSMRFSETNQIFDDVYNESSIHSSEINQTYMQSDYKKKALLNEFKILTDTVLLNNNLFAVKLKHKHIVKLVNSTLWMYNIYFFYTDATCQCCQKLAVSMAELILKYGSEHVRIIGVPLNEQTLENGSIFNIFYTPKKNSIKNFKNIIYWLKPLPGIYIQDNYTNDGIFITHMSEDFKIVEKRLSFYFEWLTRIAGKNLKNNLNKNKITNNATLEILLDYKNLLHGVKL